MTTDIEMKKEVARALLRERRCNQVNTTFTDAVILGLQALADDFGVSISDAVRIAVTQHLRSSGFIEPTKQPKS